MIMILLVYKKTYLITNDLGHCLYSVCVSLLQGFKDIFFEDIFSGLPPVRGIEHQIYLVPKTFIITNQLIKVTQ